MGNYMLYGGELYHYGVLGMKWGVRRYQNKDGSLTALGKERAKTLGQDDGVDRVGDKDNLKIPKGTAMYRMSTRERDDNDTRYVSYRQNDRNFYKGYWGNLLRETNPNAQLYEQTYETLHDVFIPSAKTRRKMLSDLLKDDAVIKSIYGDSYSNDVGNSFKNITSTWSEHKRAEYLSKFMGTNPDILSKYGKMVVERGFNAVVDDGGRTVGEMPLILFTANSSSVQTRTKKVDQLIEEVSRIKYSEIDAKKYRNKTASV